MPNGALSIEYSVQIQEFCKVFLCWGVGSATLKEATVLYIQPENQNVSGGWAA